MRRLLFSLKNNMIGFLNLKFQLFGTPRFLKVAFEKQVIQPEKTYKCDTIKLLDEKPHWKFRLAQTIVYPELFVTTFIRGRVWGSQGAVITKDNVLVEEVSREYNLQGEKHSIFLQRRIIKPEYIDATVAVISASGAEIYYHWMLDIVPRVDLLIKSKKFDSIDFFILDYSGLPFQRELLKILNIEEEKIIRSNNNWKFHLIAERLVVPSLVSPNDCPSVEACLFLRKIFNTQKSKQKPYRKIYIKRKTGRTIINETQVIEILKKYNFEIVSPENMTVAEQAFLYSEAAFVIAPHGAGLTNLVFCEPGTKVIDMFSPEWVNPCYWILSCQLGLKYSYLIGEGKRPRDYYDPQKIKSNITIDPIKLQKLIEVVNY